MIDLDNFAVRVPAGLAPLQRANELDPAGKLYRRSLQWGNATVSHANTSHPLPRAVLRGDPSRRGTSQASGGLYFEALSRIDDAELRRLGRVLHTALAACRLSGRPA